MSTDGDVEYLGHWMGNVPEILRPHQWTCREMQRTFIETIFTIDFYK